MITFCIGMVFGGCVVKMLGWFTSDAPPNGEYAADVDELDDEEE